jgi:hypothetical protein
MCRNQNCLIFLSLFRLTFSSDIYLSTEFGGGALIEHYVSRQLKSNLSISVLDIFKEKSYSSEKYPPFSVFTGNDELSMLGSSLANNEQYTVSGAYGYSK